MCMDVVILISTIVSLTYRRFKMIPGVLIGEAKVFKHGKAKTLYVTIPSAIVGDSAFTIKEGETVEIKFNKDENRIEIKPKPSKKK